MIAFKTFGQAPAASVPTGMPLDNPWMMQYCAEDEVQSLRASGWKVLSDDAYQAYVDSLADVMAAYETSLPALYIQGLVTSAMMFGQQILIQFRAENVAMGIMQDNMTGWLLEKLSSVMEAILAGSLSEAIVRLKAVPIAEYDGKYLTVPRMISFINKIEVYLGIPLTTELP